MNRFPSASAPIDGFQPIRLLEVELSQALPAVAAFDADTGRCYRHAVVLVRLHTQPLGLVRLSLGVDGLSAEHCAHRIWAELRAQILEHLREDGLPEVSRLRADGLPGMTDPRCLFERESALRDAPFVSVIVPTHDRPEHIQRCLAAMASLDYPHYEIIAVDNSPSTSDTAEVVQRMSASDQRIRYVREDRPGASWARNRGLLEARGEIVAFTDDDVVVDRFWLAELVKAFRMADRVGCVTGNVLPQQLETAAQAWFEERGGFSRGFVRRIYDRAENVPKHPLYPYCAMIFGSGNSMAFRSSLLRQIGGFDPALDPAGPALGGEDLAAFFEVIVRGHQLVYEPAAIVRHLHRRDFDALERQVYGWGTGFSAFLVRSLLAHPRLMLDFALKMPYAAAVFLNGQVPYSEYQAQTLASLFPATSTEVLRQAETAGYFHGVRAYVQSLFRVRRITKRFGSLRVDVAAAPAQKLERSLHPDPAPASGDAVGRHWGLHPVLEGVFRALEHAEIPWCVLNNPVRLPSPRGCIELLIDRANLRLARTIVEAHRFMQLPEQNDRGGAYYVSYHRPTDLLVRLRICTELPCARGMRVESACLARRQRKGDVYVLHADDRFWALLLDNLVNHQALKEEEAGRLQVLAYAARLDGPLAKVMEAISPVGWSAERILKCVLRNDRRALGDLGNAFAPATVGRASSSSATMPRVGAVLVPAILRRRPGIAVALLGPDGCGKSTLAAEIEQSYGLPVQTIYMGLWRKAEKPGKRPLLPGLSLSRRLITIWRRYLVGRYHRMLGRLVIFDRYTYDALLPSLGKRSPIGRLYAWLLGHACPGPDLVLLLDAPGQVMYARKQESTPERLEAERQGFLTLQQRVRQLQVVDATCPRDTVRADVVDRIWCRYFGR